MKKGVSMSIDQKFRYTNTAYPDKTYETTDEFFSDENCEPDMIVMERHNKLYAKYEVRRDTELSEDKKSVISTITLADVEDKREWLAERSHLPSIDKNLKEEIL